MSTQHIFNGTHQQIVSGTSALDELTIPLWPLSPDRQLHMMGDARTLTVGTVLISNTYEMDLQTFIPLYQIQRDLFKSDTFHVSQLDGASVVASATLNQIDQVWFGVPGTESPSTETLAINLLPVILAGAEMGPSEGVTLVQGTPFNDRPVIELTGISKSIDQPEYTNEGLVSMNGSQKVWELVKDLSGEMNPMGSSASSGSVLKVYDEIGQLAHEYQLDASVESVQLSFSDGDAVIRGLPFYTDYYNSAPMPLVKSILTQPDPIKVASIPTASNQDEIHFRVDLNESVYTGTYNTSDNWGNPISYELKFALQIGNAVVFADIQGHNGDGYGYGANQIWFSYPIQSADSGAVSMLGMVHTNGQDVIPYEPYTYETEYTGIAQFGNQAFSYIYPQIEFAGDPTTDLLAGGDKLVGLFDPSQIHLVSDSAVNLTGLRNTLGIAIDGSGGGLLSVTDDGGVFSVFNTDKASSTLVAKFTRNGADPSQYLFWSGSDATEALLENAVAISTDDFQQLLFILRVPADADDYVMKVGAPGQESHWTFADQSPLLFSLLTREFAEPERSAAKAWVGDVLDNSIDVSARDPLENIDLFGFQGNDTIQGHDGLNRISGGAGNDTIFAGDGHDALILGGMSDGPGHDTVDMEAGNDAISFGGYDNAYLFEGQTIRSGGGSEYFEIRDLGTMESALVARIEKTAAFDERGEVLVTTYQSDGSPLNISLVSHAEVLTNIGANPMPYRLQGQESLNSNGVIFQGSVFSEVIDISTFSKGSSFTINGGMGDDTLVLDTAEPLTAGGKWVKTSYNDVSYSETIWYYTVETISTDGEPSSIWETQFGLHRYSYGSQYEYDYWTVYDNSINQEYRQFNLNMTDVEVIEINGGTDVHRRISLIDLSAPLYQSASLRGTQLTVVFNEALDDQDLPAIEHFSLQIDGQFPVPGELDIVSVAVDLVNKNKLILSLSQTIANPKSILTLTYTDPNNYQDDSAVIQDIYGNDVASTVQPLVVQFNSTIQATELELSVGGVFTGGYGKDALDLSAATVGQDISLFYSKSAQPRGVAHMIRDVEDMKGSALQDTLKGNGWANTLDGNGDDDVLDGGLGNDVLLGGAGDDLLFGGLGHDVLYGGTGSDVMTGGIGADRFVLSLMDAQTMEVDHISDFNFVADVIQIHADRDDPIRAALADLFNAQNNALMQLDRSASAGTQSSIYYSNSGQLYFDAGGTSVPVLLAQLDAQSGAAPMLLAANIKLIDTLPILMV